MVQRLHERLQESNGNEVLKAEAGAKFQKFSEWALKCISLHSWCQGKKDRISHNSSMEIRLQLSAFKTLLDLSGNHLTGKDFTEAFDAACFPRTLFSSSFDPGWASGISATAIQGLLGIRIAQRNSLDIYVDLALRFASRYCKIGTMECLVEEGNAMAFLGPLLRAAERGCLEVVQWFVRRGCQDMELCLAHSSYCQQPGRSSWLSSPSREGKLPGHHHYKKKKNLLPRVPRHVLTVEILKAAGERSSGSLDGVEFLSDFLGDPASTYAVADSVARSEDEPVNPTLRDFLRKHWSGAVFSNGLRQGQEHYLNFVRILRWGESPFSLDDIPAPLRVTIAYLPLYRECAQAGGRLLSQRLSGQLVDAGSRLGSRRGQEAVCPFRELLPVLNHHLLQSSLTSTPSSA